ncbi:SLAP domain-containing protein [Agrilactobacillus fermenti]|uniref:SLAP domain-containing protein n=1 Tax=Agrilactobacillus fermenti TaxID=2586909 RepID=UPI003A5BC9BF
MILLSATFGGFFANNHHAKAATQIGVVDNPMGDGSVYVYDAPNGKVISGRTLPNKSEWQVGQRVSVSGSGVWYEIGQNVWINDYVLKVKDAPTTPSQNQNHTTTPTTNNGIVTAGDNAVVYNAINGSATGQTLPAGSQWRYGSQQQTADGSTWYEVGASQWLKVPSTNTPETPNMNPSDQTGISASGIVKISFTGANLRTAPNGQIVSFLNPDTRWKVLAAQRVNGTLWYELGENQWISSTTVVTDLNQANPDVVTVNENNISATLTLTSNANIYNGPAQLGGTSIGRSLLNGTAWHVSRLTTVNGTSWAEVGPNQWLNAHNGQLSY